MSIPTTIDLLSPIPDPSEVQRRLAEATAAQKLLRRLLQLSLEAQRERDGQRTQQREVVAYVR
jgi:hypothetical protein